METSQLDSALNRLNAALTVLEENDGSPPSEAILKTLIARDSVQAALADVTQIPEASLIAVTRIDSRLKNKSELIAQTVLANDWPASFNPPQEHWWWFLEAPIHRLDRFDWVWNALTVASFTASLSLVVDISSRFVSGGPGFLGSFAIISQSALTLLTAGGVLTEAGRKGIEEILSRLGIKKYLWQEVKLGLSGVLLLSLIGFRVSLPLISDYFNERGLDNYLTGDWSSAQSDYKRALSLNPDNAEAHYNLGRLYEDLQELDKAWTQYRLSAQAGLDAAYNALGRIYIQENKNSQAASLLLRGLEKLQEGDAQTQYALLKNLGWARLKQERYADAETYLREAIALEGAFEQTPAAAHCLLAQVIEKKEGQDSALQEWEICLGYADVRYPEEDAWYGMARERVDDQDESNESTK